MSLSIGQEWRCRGGGEWRIISKNADGAFVGQSLRAPAVLWQFQADGRTCLSLSERERSTMDLVELLAPKAPQ